MDLNLWKIGIYEWSYRYRHFVAVLWWVVLMSLLAWIGFLPWSGLYDFRQYAWPIPILGIAWLATSVIWLCCCAWYVIWFRYVAWWVARGIGAMLGWFTTGWRAALLLLLAVSATMWWRYRVIGYPHAAEEFLKTALALKTMAAAVLVLILYWGYKARKRIVIQTFINYTGEEKLKAAVDGLSGRLLNELARLSHLYSTVDEAIPTKGKEIIEATITVEDAGQSLKEAVSADSKVSLGPLQIPVGAIMGVVGRLVQGPRLTGSLHMAGDRLNMIASISGGGFSGNWNVALIDLDEGGAVAGEEVVSLMTEQMACRIFTDLVRVGSPRWRAVRYYSCGLALYRDAMRTKRDKKLKLRNAEETFIQSLEEDNEFALAHYNLGIVYRALKREDSAMAAFREAIKKGKDLSGSCLATIYHALALCYRSKEEYKAAIGLSEQSIALQPAKAEAWDFKGFAMRKQYEKGHGKLEAGNAPELWKQILPIRQHAVALAWRALCFSALNGRSDKPERGIAATCLRNLAIAHGMLKESDRSASMFRQAIRLSQTDADLYFESGKVYADAAQLQDAVRVLEKALVIEERTEIMLELSEAYAKLWKKTEDSQFAERVLYLCKRVLYYSPATDGPAWDITWGKILKTLHLINEKKSAGLFEVIEAICSLFSGPPPQKHKDENDADYLKRLETELSTQNEWSWARSQYLVRQAQIAGDMAKGYAKDASNRQICLDHAVVKIEGAIAELKKEYTFGTQEVGLHSRLASLYLEKGGIAKALYHAERAVVLDPENADARRQLGEVYLAIRDYDRAESQCSISLQLEPASFNTLQTIALIPWNRGVTVRDPERRRQAFSRVTDIMGCALAIIEWDGFGQESSADDMDLLGWVHYWLGRFNTELKRYDEAIYHLIIVQELGLKPLLCKLALGWAYLEAKTYDLAEQAFAKVVEEAKKKTTAERAGFEPGANLGEDMSIVELLVQAHLCRASAFAERGVNLDKAIEYCNEAVGELPNISESKKQDHEALKCDCLGWILFRKELLFDAVKELEKSVALKAEVGAYYHLALTYGALAETVPIDSARWLAKASEACVQARAADLRGRYVSDLDEVISKLERLKKMKERVKAPVRPGKVA